MSHLNGRAPTAKTLKISRLFFSDARPFFYYPGVSPYEMPRLQYRPGRPTVPLPIVRQVRRSLLRGVLA